MIWQSSYSVQLSLLTWLAHQILIVLLVDTFKMSQVAGSSTYGIMLRSDSMIFKSCVCYYFCFSDNNFHSLLSCAKSCKWIRKNFSRDLFIVCEECVALACNNGITAGLKLEIPFLVSLSIVCPHCGVNHVTHTDLATVVCLSVLHEEHYCHCALKKSSTEECQGRHLHQDCWTVWNLTVVSVGIW